MITICRSPTADTRTCDFAHTSKETLLACSPPAASISPMSIARLEKIEQDIQKILAVAEALKRWAGERDETGSEEKEDL